MKISARNMLKGTVMTNWAYSLDSRGSLRLENARQGG